MRGQGNVMKGRRKGKAWAQEPISSMLKKKHGFLPSLMNGCLVPDSGFEWLIPMAPDGFFIFSNA